MQHGRRFDNGEGALTTDDVQQICSKIQGLVERLQIGGAKPIVFVIFNEYFFGRWGKKTATPMDRSHVNSVVNVLNNNFKENKNVFVYPHFLFVDNTAYKSLRDKKFATFNEDKKRSKCGVGNGDPKRQISVFNQNAQKYLRSVSWCLNGGDTLTQYKKSSYFKEWDHGLTKSHECFYDFGTGQDETVNENEISRRLLETVSTEICFDLNLGVRRNHEQSLRGSTQKLHIIQSNTIDIMRDYNMNNLLDNILVVQADPAALRSSTTRALRMKSRQAENNGKVENYEGFCFQEEELFCSQSAGKILTGVLKIIGD